MAKDSPQRYLATASKAARRRPHLRRLPAQRPRRHGGRRLLGARAGRRTVSTPLAWDELGPEMRPDRFTVLNLLHRLAHIDDPWRDVRKMARRLPT